MKRSPHLSATVACAAAFALVSAPSLAPAAGSEPGWVQLFDGQTLSGWKQLGGKAKYEVRDGAILGTAVPKTENSFLVTARDYADFILEFEFKVDARLNSGVQIRSQSLPEYKNGRVHGYQVEIDPDPKRARWWTAGIYDEARRGWLCPAKDDKAAGEQFTAQGGRCFKPGGWNKIRVEAIGPRIRTWLNGQPRADLTDDMTPSGFIALQVHNVKEDAAGTQVQWRNIRIQEPAK